MTVGEKNPNKPNKTILLVGETGTGKSTLINAMVNYVMGVKWEDEVWFQIVEEEKKSQTESQTSDVIVYEIFGCETKYSLTIIDTPGYKDTKGREHDDITNDRLLDLFSSNDGVHEISAVCLVMKASVNRVGDDVRYIFDRLMSLFGKNLEKNIVVLITHSAGRKPQNVFEALEAVKIKCARNETNEPVYFLFDNCQHEERTKDEEEELEHAAKISEGGMTGFTHFLEITADNKMMDSVDVMKERIRLKACLQNLLERIDHIEGKQKEIKKLQEALDKYKEDMEKNEKFTEMKDLATEKSQWLEESYHHVVKLEQIALKADSASTIHHLDKLIEKVKKNGDTRTTQKLEEMRSRVDEETRAGLQ
ncbi:immune-associated nucleotide-binding protein 10-like [Oreochromis aureus]|uniref:immune-associated nucleotide-binding protein 10-like n=1 Tax=Oreochromis aureus TaxID=47969 RepID=UPI001952B7A2|nr:immune-associated nucleotide-binding protein 10-like [Oreochromis aureus]